MDTSVKPGEDFNQYVNGVWLKQNEIPADYSRWGLFEQLGEKNNEILREIMEEAARCEDASDLAKTKSGNFWKVAMDEARLEKEGIEPLNVVLKRIEQAPDVAHFLEVLTDLQMEKLSDLFEIGAEADLTNSELIICWLDQAGIGLPDRDYYTMEDKADIRKQYVEHVSKMLQMIGETEANAQAHADVIMAMETRLAESSLTKVERRNPMNLHHVMDIDALATLCPAIDWKKYFSQVGTADPGPINVTHPKYFETLSAMLSDVPLESWKIYAKWHTANAAAAYLNDAISKLDFSFFGKVLGGQTEQKPRWKRVLSWGNEKLGELIGQVYCAKVFTPEAKASAIAIVGKLQAALRDRIQTVDWMGEETKKKALTKLDKFGVKIGYPNVWIDYSELKVGGDTSLLNNIRSANTFEHHRQIKRMNKPVDRERWEMPPQTINAYYHPLRNEICFPAAILQPPVFAADADPAMNYGAMGAIIGHEMTHGYDDSGRKFDADGNMADWWSSEDAEEFEKRAKKIVDQFGSYETFGKKVNGELTQGENIADYGGMKISYLALLKELEANPHNELIDGFTQHQRFFLSWAQMWRSNIREQAAHHRIVVDPHSPEKFRVNGTLCQLDEFHRAFNISAGDAMYLPEDNRMNIW